MNGFNSRIEERISKLENTTTGNTQSENKDKIDLKKKKNKPSGICGAGTKELTFLSLEF